MSRARDLADLGGSADAGGLTGRNLIINGAMTVAARGTSSTSDSYQTVDRFRNTLTGLDNATVTQSQSSESPDGFSNSYKMTVGGTAESALAADEIVHCNQVIEAQNLQHLQYGASSPLTTTLSFWVRSSIVGTYACHFLRTDTSNRARTETYTINTANTWEYKTITIDGDTTNAIANDNGQGISIYWVLAAGSNFTSSDLSGSWQTYASTGFAYGQTVNLVGTANATWQITGVQFEVGDTATPFEHRSYGDELFACQRYYQAHGNGTNGLSFSIADMPASIATDTINITGKFFVKMMRAAPTMVIYSRNSTANKVSLVATGLDYATSTFAPNVVGVTGFHLVSRSGGSNLTKGDGFEYGYTADAEL